MAKILSQLVFKLGIEIQIIKHNISLSYKHWPHAIIKKTGITTYMLKKYKYLKLMLITTME